MDIEKNLMYITSWESFFFFFFFPQSLSKVSNEWPIQVPLHHQKFLDYYCYSNLLYRNSCALGHKSDIKPANTAGFNSFHRTSSHWNIKSCQKQYVLKSGQLIGIFFWRKTGKASNVFDTNYSHTCRFFFLHPSLCDLCAFKFSFLH